MVARIGPKNPTKMRVFLREWREHFDLTQETVAGRIGTTKGTVSRMEKSTREPNLGYLAAFAEALDIDTGQLFRLPGAPSSEELRQLGASPEELRAALQLVRMAKTGTDG
jgi:transcriptional regulator with XRE-family HTH domain